MQLAASDAVRTDLDQDVFWKTRDGLIHLVDDLDDSHRVNCARYLVDHAAHYHARRRKYWYEWTQFFGVGSYGDVPDDVFDDAMALVNRPGWVMARIRKEQDRGDHLDWMRSRPMFLRMVRGLEDRLPAGVL